MMYNLIFSQINIEQQWESFINAPFIYITSLISVATIIWIFINYLYKTRLESKSAIIEALEKQLSIYKDKKYIIGETTYSKLSDTQLL
ncbi:hypothetical protein SanaruYs_37420 [Chryseotalea sanaruensis]|uniref:Uncharacterized protein n=1 Tax=Chryseotalea sanaruensis TaxID=2482724 RepID=A0A401UF49_9BACT|nr:hypothetical protein SanaruYs_37420 [Chryseotalea sanaruensis]